MTGGITRPTVLPLKQARLCLDCDCLTDEPFCRQCDRAETVPIAGWFRPLEAGPADTVRQTKVNAPPERRWILVVQHQQRDLYRILRQALDGTGVEVVYERRVGQRRRVAAGPRGDEQRRADRRRTRANATGYEGAGAVPEPGSAGRPGADRLAVPVARPRRRQPAPV
jgi:hypothetical protein